MGADSLIVRWRPLEGLGTLQLREETALAMNQSPAFGPQRMEAGRVVCCLVVCRLGGPLEPNNHKQWWL